MHGSRSSPSFFGSVAPGLVQLLLGAHQVLGDNGPGLWRTTSHGGARAQCISEIVAVDVDDIARKPVDVREIYAAPDGSLWRTVDVDDIARKPVDVRGIYAAPDGSLWRTVDFDTISLSGDW